MGGSVTVGGHRHDQYATTEDLLAVTGMVNVRSFGARIDGVTSDVAAVEAAIGYANAHPGTTLFFPHGTYNLKAGVSAVITASLTRIVGDNCLVLCESGSVFAFDAGALMHRCEVGGFEFQYPAATVSDTAVPVALTSVLYARVRDIRVANAPRVIYLTGCSNIFVDGVTGTTANVAQSALEIDDCSVVTVDRVSLVNSVDLQPLDPAESYPDPPVSGNVFIRVSGTNDTLTFGAGVLCNRYHRGAYLTCATGNALLNVLFDGSIFDYCYDKGVYVYSTGGSAATIKLRDNYIVSMNGVGVHVENDGGFVQNISVIRPLMPFSGTHGIQFTGPYVVGCRVEGAVLGGGDRIGGGSVSAIHCTETDVDIIGGILGQDSTGLNAYGCQHTYGVTFDTCTRFTLTDASVLSVQTSGLPASNYVERRVFDNRRLPGASPALNYVPSFTSAAMASGTTYTNTTPFKQSVTLTGSAGVIAATVTLNGNTVALSSEWSGLLDPGDALSITHAGSVTRTTSNVP